LRNRKSKLSKNLCRRTSKPWIQHPSRNWISRSNRFCRSKELWFPAERISRQLAQWFKNDYRCPEKWIKQKQMRENSAKIFLLFISNKLSKIVTGETATYLKSSLYKVKIVPIPIPISTVLLSIMFIVAILTRIRIKND